MAIASYFWEMYFCAMRQRNTMFRVLRSRQKIREAVPDSSVDTDIFSAAPRGGEYSKTTANGDITHALLPHFANRNHTRMVCA